MSLLEYYHYVNTDLTDKRTRDWVLISSPLDVTLLSLIYLYLVLRWGPRYMEKRPAYKLHTFIRVYNIFQIIANAWMAYSLIEAAWHGGFFFACSSPYANTPHEYKLCVLGWYLLYIKLSDYIETVVFVLRKKQSQVTFLHLYHHVTTVLLTWFYVKYFPNETTVTSSIMNCIVHVVMYSYYLLASFGPSIQKSLRPVKQSITTMQLVQFVLMILLSLRIVFVPGCTGAKVYAGTFLVDIIINFILFTNFYIQNYIKPNNKQE